MIEIIALCFSIISAIIGFILTYLFNRKERLISKTIEYQQKFLSIYTYLYKNNDINVNDKLYDLEIFSKSLLFTNPNIFNENFFLKNNNNLSKKEYVLNDSLFCINSYLKNFNNKSINNTKKYWKKYYLSINKIQKIIFKFFDVSLCTKTNKLIFNNIKNADKINLFYIVFDHKQVNKNKKEYIKGFWKIYRYLKNKYRQRISYYKFNVEIADEKNNLTLIFERNKLINNTKEISKYIEFKKGVIDE